MTARIPLVINSGAIQELQSGDSFNLGTGASLTSPTIATSMTLSYGTANQVQYLNGSKQLVGDADLTFDGTTLSVAAINVTTVDLTNLEVTNIKAKDGTAAITLADSTGVATFSANPTLSAGTANGVAYLNGSKVLTSGSALTFDGVTLKNAGGIAAQGLSYPTTGAGLELFSNGSTDTTIQSYNRTSSAFMSTTYSALNHIFGVSGSEQMRLTSTGLGIGTSSITDPMSWGRLVQIYKSNYAAYSIKTDTAQWDIANYQSALAFYNGSERMRINSSGNLGVGTSSPTATVHAYKASGNAEVAIESAAGTSVFSLLGGQPVVGYSSTGNLRIGTVTGTAAAGFSERMRIDSSGNVGIGTSSPSGKLHLLAATDASCIQTWETQGTTSRQWKWFISGGAGGGNFYLQDATASANRLTVDTSGNLGLGVTPSSSRAGYKFFEIGSEGINLMGGPIDVALTSNAKWSGGGWKYAYSGSAQRAAMYNIYDAAHYWFTTGSTGGTAGNAITFTQAMTLDASGRLLLGTTDGTNAKRLTVLNGSDNSDVAVFSGGDPIRGLKISTAINTYNDAIVKLDAQESTYGTLAFLTRGSERMRIDSSGNVGIGTSSPASTVLLELKEPDAGQDLIVGLTAGTGARSQIRSIAQADSTTSALSFYTVQGSNANERMRIDSSGNLCLGTPTASAKLSVQTAGNNYGIFSYNTDTSTTSSYLYWGYTNTGTKFIVYGNGGIANYQANNSNLSDRREKTDFAPAKSYLDAICAIPVQTFKYIDQQDDEPTLGVVAQDVQAVAPELVTESNWNTEENPKMRLSIYQTDLQYALMKCIQELKAELDATKAEVAALKGA